jgi:hypothetical protein
MGAGGDTVGSERLMPAVPPGSQQPTHDNRQDNRSATDDRSLLDRAGAQHSPEQHSPEWEQAPTASQAAIRHGHH